MSDTSSTSVPAATDQDGVAVEAYKEAFRKIDQPALITDQNFVIRDVNKGGLEFTGYDREEMVGQPATIISGNDRIYEEIIEKLVDGDRWHGRFVARTKSGKTAYGRGMAASIEVDGEVVGYVAVFLDMTKELRYENASQVLNRLLRHDLRNELNVMYGHIQRAQSITCDEDCAAELEEAKEKITRIVRRSERARDLQELLERSADDQNHPVRLDIVLNNQIVKAMDEFEEAEFYFDIFPELRVTADDLLPAVVSAILENAVVHNDKEIPEVTVEVEENATDVVVRIADNGPGIPPAHEDLIFGREEYDKLHHGTGIDLFFADNVVSNYDGEIWIEENEPEGTVFNIRLKRR